MGVLGILAVVALVVGGVETTMILTEPDALSAQDAKAPVVAVQKHETDRSGSSGFEL